MTPSGGSARLAVVLLVTLFGHLGPIVSSVSAQENPDVFISRECPDVNSFIRSPDGVHRLLSPILQSRAEVDAAVSEVRDLLDCLESVRYRTVLPDWFGSVRENLELFLSFASLPPGAAEDALEFIDLGAVSDPAVVRLRRDVGLIPPVGFIFVRYFESRQLMPGAVRMAFENPETQAITIGSRYIAVLVPSGMRGGGARRLLQETLSHEMVHAFLNAGLIWDGTSGGFPSWFHEGMAIHFSQSGRAHLGVDSAGGVVRVGPTPEYEGYERLFLYLENRLGAQEFNRAIRRSVETSDAAALIAAAGATDYATVSRDAERWWRWWPLPPTLTRGWNLWIGGAAMFAALSLSLVWWRRWQPAVPGSSLEVTLNQDLLEAIRDRDPDTVRTLLRSGADPNARDAEGRPALVWAIWTGSFGIVSQLVERGALVDGNVRRVTDWHGDPDIERVIADRVAGQRDVW